MRLKRLSPRRMFVLGFFGVIMIGTFLLMLPEASATEEHLGFADALFMSTSCVCVTGLATIDPGTGLTFFGQLVMAVLIQIGGLGITSIGVMVIMAAGAFVQGSSIELSADGPIKPPYAVYFQGGLTWYHAKLGILMSLEKLKKSGVIQL